MRDAVQKWLESGAEVQAGLRLLSLYAKNEHLARLVTARPDRYKSLLIDTLCKAAGTSPLTPHLDIERRNRLKAKERELAAVNKMIEEYERTIRP